MGYVNSLEGNHMTFVLTNDASTTMMPGEHDQAIGLQRLESQKDRVSRHLSRSGKWFAPGSQPILRGKTPWELMIMIVLRKKSRATKRKSGKIFCEQFCSNPKKGVHCWLDSSLTISSHFFDGGSMVYLRFSWPKRGQNPPAVSDDRFEALGLPPA